MTTKNLLHYQYDSIANTNKPTLVFIHGLFGDMNNLGVIARAFSDEYPILRVDLRNHGESFHSDKMNYELMANDLLQVFTALKLQKVILIGHSMGGKTAMKTAEIAPHFAPNLLIEKLIVIDIAPVTYQEKWHKAVFEGLFAVQQEKPLTRQQARPILAQHIREDAIVQFMLKSFAPQRPQYFCFNVTALFHNYDHLMGWQKVHCTTPTLFIKGGNSDYILPQYSDTVLQQFPNATSFVIANAGHWVHAEKPDNVVRAIQRFLEK